LTAVAAALAVGFSQGSWPHRCASILGYIILHLLREKWVFKADLASKSSFAVTASLFYEQENKAD
jgi:hypothetical protein